MYRFILEPYKGQSTRFRCPKCGKTSVYTRYIDRDTMERLDAKFGKCNREIKCGYHFSQYNDISVLSKYSISVKSEESVKNSIKLKNSYINSDIFEKSLLCYKQNDFVKGLYNRFDFQQASEAVRRYRIGTSKKWGGACVFWQLDDRLNIRSGKIIKYSASNLRRIKKNITWVHSELKMKDFVLKQCLFGLHLINEREKNATIGIVESEKTAVVCSIVFPELIWMATGGIHNLKEENVNILKGRQVILFPDLGATEKWRDKVSHISLPVQISDYLEVLAYDKAKEEGWDLADFVLSR